MKFRIFSIAALSLTLAGCEAWMTGNVLAGCAMRATPEILPRALPLGKVGAPYSARIDVINTSAPVGKLLISPESPLPAGVQLAHIEREKHGLIQGVPAEAGTYEVLIYASTYGTPCAGQYVERRYQLEVAP
jgi:hypothetical protein